MKNKVYILRIKKIWKKCLKHNRNFQEVTKMEK